MSFKTLEQRFNESAKNIYGRYTNEASLVAEIKPDSNASRSRIKDDTRSVPAVSTRRDTSRIGSFLKSRGGVLFLSKQTLLQTGNVFAETRLYNPLETLANTIPFVHVRRNTGFPSILGTNRGALQKETIDSFTPASRGLLGQAINTVLSPVRALNTTPTLVSGKSGNFFERPEDVNQWYPKLLAKQPLESQGQKRPAGLYDTLDARYDFIKNTGSFANYPVPRTSGNITFRDLESTNYGNGYYAKLNNGITDPYNLQAISSASLFQNQLSYNSIVGNKEEATDIIKFIFSEADGTNPVHFRALISSIKENIKPEYTEQRYVGRIERFVTYSGVKRSVSLQFNIVAMSDAELDNMWLRINNLSGRAFPKAISANGFMVPPLFKITVGGIYENQPCYIDSLDYDFLDESITFDIDKEVSKVINVNMSLILLEKRTKVYDSPFYGITEKFQGVKDRAPSVASTPASGAPSPVPVPTASTPSRSAAGGSTPSAAPSSAGAGQSRKESIAAKSAPPKSSEQVGRRRTSVEILTGTDQLTQPATYTPAPTPFDLAFGITPQPRINPFAANPMGAAISQNASRILQGRSSVPTIRSRP
jgi:hypothetical protein